MHRMQKTGREGLALTSVAAWLRLVIIVIAGSAADLWTKAWAQQRFEFAGRYGDAQGAPAPDIPFIDLIWQQNRGAVFGVGQNQTAFLIIFTFAAIALLVWLYAQSRRRGYMLQIILALIAAGALGNLYDRINYGHVRDFLQFNITAGWASWGGPEGLIWPWVFNIADVWISIGVVGLAILAFAGVPITGEKPQKKPSSADAAGTGGAGDAGDSGGKGKKPANRNGGKKSGHKSNSADSPPAAPGKAS